MSFTWYIALQGEYIRTFLPVYVPRETKFRNDLESPLAQGDAVLRPETHVSPVKPLHAGGARRAAVHLGTFFLFFMRRRVQPVRGRQLGGALRPDPYPVRNEERLARRARCVGITGCEVLGSNPRYVQ